MPLLVLIYGGGDLASGVAARLYRSGIQVVIAELPQPVAVRRSVSFASAVYEGDFTIEGIHAVRIERHDDMPGLLKYGKIPVLVDPDLTSRHMLLPDVIVDGRMMKKPPNYDHPAAPLVIGLGPGFLAGVTCHAVVETMRGHYLGRVYWHGEAEPDTGVPESVQNHQTERVLRAPADGRLNNRAEIGDVVQQGDTIADVNGAPVRAHFSGLLRGLLHHGLFVHYGMKIGDLDPRMDKRMHLMISDKALAIGGGVLEAILSVSEMRKKLAQTDED
jgi:xanthine dehydrogenase accessory factor